ncbi:hypothetical protein GOP47_0021649 [Adiantum capillus-veneris]|uniref:Oxidation resistance protein 1 n=1 Tax=Adiantum capillus-veneris TaxID=13818 RepID=A0A9D4U8S1_ADICA|nr:hypothetical protein GOP47_0021649 [Adiantum capillus-veneris]
MGWKGKLANKVGHYLSQSLEFPLKHLYTYPSPSRSQESTSVEEGFREFQQRSGTSIETPGGIEDEYGPDTTSLTAFLLSLLSSSDNSSRRGSDSAEESDTEQDGSAGSLGHNKANDDAGNNKIMGFGSEGSERRVHPLEVSEVVSNSFKSRLQAASHQAATSASPRLPPMSEDSLLLSESFRALLYSAMPIIVKDRHWILLYSTAKHGISLRTLYRKSAALPDPFLLVVGDVRGATFGGLLTTPLKPTTKRKYLGTNEMFVFTNANGNPRIFKATGANRYYLLCMNDAISLGGGGHFAVHLDEDLLNGSSGACDTYGNECLATSVDFTISHVELWGFAHAISYI